MKGLTTAAEFQARWKLMVLQDSAVERLANDILWTLKKREEEVKHEEELCTLWFDRYRAKGKQLSAMRRQLKGKGGK